MFKHFNMFILCVSPLIKTPQRFWVSFSSDVTVRWLKPTLFFFFLVVPSAGHHFPLPPPADVPRFHISNIFFLISVIFSWSSVGQKMWTFSVPHYKFHLKFLLFRLQSLLLSESTFSNLIWFFEGGIFTSLFPNQKYNTFSKSSITFE